MNNLKALDRSSVRHDNAIQVSNLKSCQCSALSITSSIKELTKGSRASTISAIRVKASLLKISSSEMFR
jgi:hypothetical protein